jgi:poly(3-hydroxybutyrate) depolymerase
LFLFLYSIIVLSIIIKNKWQGVPGVEINDVTFTADILKKIESSYYINKDRIWVTGKSDGGGFTNVLACDASMSKRFAAFAPVSGAYYVDTLPCAPSTVNITCHAARSNIPFLAFHGGNDTTISYSGGERKGECLPSIPHFIREWAARDKLDSSKNITTGVASNTVDYSFGLTGLVRLVYDSVIGHDWPSTIPNADNQQPGHHLASFNATPIVLDFFDRHPLALD